MLDCLFIGSATKDTLLMVEAPPASDQRIAASAVVHACGGVASVAASAFQKLGGSAGLITVVGDPSDVTDFIASNIAERQLPYVDLIRYRGRILLSVRSKWKQVESAASPISAGVSGN